MHFIVLASLVFYSLFEGANHSVPLYSEAVEKWTTAKYQAEKLAPPGGIKPMDLPHDNPRRHYGVLVSVLDILTDKLSVTCETPSDEAYHKIYDEAVIVGVAKAWNLPGEVGGTYRGLLEAVHEGIEMIVQTVRSCKVSTDVSALECDALVQKMIDQNPSEYKSKAELLMLVGRLSEEYLKNTFEKESQDYEVIRLVTIGKDKLKTLTMYSVAVRQKVEKKC